MTQFNEDDKDRMTSMLAVLAVVWLKGSFCFIFEMETKESPRLPAPVRVLVDSHISYSCWIRFYFETQICGSKINIEAYQINILGANCIHSAP